MRWVVELPAPSGGIAATVTVESDSWAGALSSARGGVSIRKFRCEFENDGVVRVNDLEANERYTVRPYRASVVPAAEAPSDAAAPAVLRGVTIPPGSTRPSRAPAPAGGTGFSVAPPPGTSVAIPPRSSTPPVSPIAADPTASIDAPAALSSTVITSAVPAVQPQPAVEPVVAPAAPAQPVVAAPTPAAEVAKPAERAAEVAPTPSTEPLSSADLAKTTVDLPIFVAPAAVAEPPKAEAPAVTVPAAPEETSDRPQSHTNGAEATTVTSTLLFERDQDPSATNPLTYRERVLAVAPGTSVPQAEALARQTLTTLKRSLATRPRGRYVTVAVFDHVFSTRPTESPLVVLRWKDWRSDIAEMQVRPALAPVVAPTPTAPPEAPVVAPAPVVEAPVVAEAPAPVEAPAPPAVEPAPVAAAPVVVEPAPPVVEPVPVAAAAVVVEPAPVAAAPVVEAAPVAVAPVVEATPVAAAPVVEATPVAAAPVVEAAPVVAVAPVVESAPVVAAPAVVEPAPVAAAPAVAEAPVVEATPVVATPASAEPAPVATPAAPVEAPVAPVAEAPAAVAEVAPSPAPVAAASAEVETSGEHEAGSPESSGESGGRRKKRRGRRDSQPSLPKVEVEAPVVAADRKRFTGGRRGPDLLSDLFDSVMELSFQHGVGEACSLVSNIITQNLRCDAVLVFSYDINRDEFVVHGEANTGRLEHRVRAKSGSYGVATRSKRGVNLAAAKGDDRADEACEGGPAMFIPALFHDRLFALLQVARLPGSPPFEADELDAATYLSGQLAEALSHLSLRQTATDLSEHLPGPAKDAGRRR